MKVYTNFCSLSTERSNRSLAPLALLLFVALACVLLAACGSSRPPKATLEAEEPDLVLWPHAEKAIRLRFIADQDLNTHDSRPHSIQVCVYQLDSPEAFRELARTRDGINTLLKAEMFDKSVKSVVRLFVQPREDVVFELNRVENATFVGIVSGFFDSTPENSAKIREIRPKETTPGFLFWKPTIYSAGTLDLTLRLTARAMMEDIEPRRERQAAEDPAQINGSDGAPDSIVENDAKAGDDKKAE